MECTRHILSTTCFPVSKKSVVAMLNMEECGDQNANKMSDEAETTLVERPSPAIVKKPNVCKCTEAPDPCLHTLAKNGQLDKLKEAFGKLTDNDELFKIDKRKRTLLHYAANYKGDQEKACACVDLIIGEARLRHLQMSEFINMKDELGITALYLGVKAENLPVCEALIRAYADWDIQCNRRKSPIQKMFKKIPHIIASYFLQMAVDNVTYANEEASEVLIDFGILIGYPSDEDIKLNKTSLYEETDFLSNLCYTPVDKREEILCHPLVKTFIHIKWQKIKIFFWISRAFQTIWALIYFWFLMEVYRKLCPFPSTQQFEFSWLGFMPDVDPWILNTTETSEDSSSTPTIYKTLSSNCRSPEWIQATAYILLILATFDLLYFEVHPTYIRFRRYWYPMKTVNLRKLYKRVLLFFRLMHMEKSLLLLTIYLNVLPLLAVSFFDPFGEWQYISASVGVFLTWLHIFLQIGKIPRLAVYIKMLEKVLSTLGVITMIYISIIFAFGMVFCILLPGVPSYSSPFQAILKMSTFLIGELEYERFFYEENSKHISVSLSASMCFYGVAILVLHIALLNFLIGLTVTDVQNIEKYTEVWRSFCHVWQISLFESFLSRCPFRLGLPWLRRISITAALKTPKRSTVENESLGSIIDPYGMLVKIRLKDLPKPLTKDIREMLRKRNQENSTE